GQLESALNETQNDLQLAKRELGYIEKKNSALKMLLEDFRQDILAKIPAIEQYQALSTQIDEQVKQLVENQSQILNRVKIYQEAFTNRVMQTIEHQSAMISQIATNKKNTDQKHKHKHKHKEV